MPRNLKGSKRIVRANKKLKAVLNYLKEEIKKDNLLSDIKFILPVHLNFLKFYDEDVLSDQQINGYLLILDSYLNFSKESLKEIKEDLNKKIGSEKLRILSSLSHPS